jgi:hypothetical protein
MINNDFANENNINNVVNYKYKVFLNKEINNNKYINTIDHSNNKIINNFNKSIDKYTNTKNDTNKIEKTNEKKNNIFKINNNIDIYDSYLEKLNEIEKHYEMMKIKDILSKDIG